MIDLVQGATQLLGSETAIDDLAKKDSAKIFVISDSHGNKNTFKLLVANAPEKCDALVFCGDGMGDLVSCCEETMKDESFAENFPPVVAFVSGNGDGDRYPVRFNPKGGSQKKGNFYSDIDVPYAQEFYAAGKKIFITHGHRYGAYYGMENLIAKAQNIGADCVLYGHTHVAKEVFQSGVYLMNPGSITYPRSSLPASCAILSIEADAISSVFYRFNAKSSQNIFSPLNVSESPDSLFDGLGSFSKFFKRLM